MLNTARAPRGAGGGPSATDGERSAPEAAVGLAGVGLEASPRQVEQAVRRLGELRDRSGTFVPVVAATMAPPPIAAELGVEFETVTSRANW